MSGYEKLQYSDENEYDTSRALQDPMYLAYVQPGFPQPHVHPSVVPYNRHPDQVAYAPSALYEPRAAFEASQSSYIEPQPRQVPEIRSYTPRQGPQGTQVYVNIASTYDLLATPSFALIAMFARRRCRFAATRIDDQGPYYQYLLTAEAPPHSTTGWASPQVPLRLQVQDESGMDADTAEIGSYTYTDVMQQAQASPPQVTRKRKISFGSAEATRLPAKRTSAQQLRSSGMESYDLQMHQQQGYSSYLQKPPSVAVESSLGNLLPYHRSQSQQSYQPQDSPRGVSHHPSTSSASSLSQLRIPSPQAAPYSPSKSTISQASRSPGLAVAPVTRISSMPSPSGKTNPPLIRTSTLQQTPSPAATPRGVTAAGSFNPYAMYPHKAVLKINGDLDAMAENWTEEEWEAKRRLVQFWRSQSGSTISTNFEPVAPDERPPNSICISCIWWEQKKECYVTSVDTIYLLESLVAVRFTVEEKNRIRRNLEGFKPMTVSKGKSDSEEFFKLIMGYPNPKPRNIEKDVKVFPWKILSHALKKIIGKYSASYSSTAGALLPPAGAYGGTAATGGGVEQQPSTSPRSGSKAAICSAYAPALTSTTLSPNLSHGRLSVPFTSAGQPMLQVPVSSLAHTYAAPTQLYQYAAQAPMTPSSAAGPMMAQPRRGSWDFSSFIETSPADPAPANAQGYHYQRGDLNSPAPAEASATRYQMTHTSAGS